MPRIKQCSRFILMSISELASLLTDAEVDVALSSAQHQHVLNALGLRLLRRRRALALRRTVQHAAVEGGENVACACVRKEKIYMKKQQVVDSGVAFASVSDRLGYPARRRRT